jgi:hypothetical protein
VSDSDIVLGHSVHSQLVPIPRSASMSSPIVYESVFHGHKETGLPMDLDSLLPVKERFYQWLDQDIPP